MVDVGILGGGITGLFLARFLGEGAEVLEKDARAGGLARSFGSRGFRSDVGGHILFSKDKEALGHELAVLGDNVRQGVRKNRILYGDFRVRYPFENGLDALDPEDRVAIAASFIDARDAETNVGDVRTFGGWLLHTFGAELVARYLGPYNEKIWKTPLAEMSTEWVERIPRPPLVDVLRGVAGLPTEGYTHQLYFQYPKEGGFEALPRAVARDLGDRVTTKFPVSRILYDAASGFVVSSGSRERDFRALVSTLPIDTLLSCLDGVPLEVRTAAATLRYNALAVVLVGIEGEALPDYTALYVPRPESLYHRVCFNHVFSPDNVPWGHESLSCEITYPPGSALERMSDDDLGTAVIADLVEDGILPIHNKSSRVVHVEVHREPLAYVVPTLGHARAFERVRHYVESLGIHLAGRFAEYKYINTDACVRRALDLARELRGGSIAVPEVEVKP